jgi:L-alanine-DL-glutamate epimerase-like enolase superfamily enzyme
VTAAIPEIRIARVDAAEVRCTLPEPIQFGDWVMTHRAFTLVRVESEAGAAGHAFTLTRDGPLTEAVRRSVRPHYLNRNAADPAALAARARRSNLSTFCAGIGLRALSIVDIATWDLVGKTVGRSIVELLGGEPRPIPATAIIGYPPSVGPEQVEAQVSQLFAQGWRRFKMPIGATTAATYERLEAASAAAPGCVLSLDGAWTFDSVDAAADFCANLPVEIDWFEDVFPPGDPRPVAELRSRVPQRIAMGDEQGGSYYPYALVTPPAVDVVRLDATCMGGISQFAGQIEEVRSAGLAFAPHMNAHVHYGILAGLGILDVPVEWGIPGTGVDPFADSLEQPRIVDGRMLPLNGSPGFGQLVNRDWLVRQDLDDPDGLAARLEAS